MIGFDDTPPPAAPRPLTHRSFVARAIHSMGWLSRLLFVLFYLEVGFALLVVPWSMFWDRNYFAQTLPAVGSIITNDFVRGAVSGLGLVNIGVGIAELVAMLLARHHESDVTALRTSTYED